MKRNRGFTYLELLLSLFIQSLVFLLIVGCLQVTMQYVERLRSDKQVEWHLFLQQVELDTTDTNLAAIGARHLLFITSTGERINYEYVGSQIRREKNGGHNPVLTGIVDIQYFKGKYGFWIEVIFKNGEVRKGFIHNEEISAHERVHFCYGVVRFSPHSGCSRIIKQHLLATCENKFAPARPLQGGIHAIFG